MQPVYIDLHIHTYPDANNRTTDYDIVTLVRKIKEYNGDEPFLISFTDHNTINRDVYLAAKAVGVNLLLGAELHIKNHDDVEAFHCHIYFNLDVTRENIDTLNDILDKLYESIRNGVTQLKVIGDRASLLLSGPFWLLQLWLNATFESCLPQKNKINEEAPEILNRRVEGTRLVLLTPTDEGQKFQKAFTSFVMMFAERQNFVSTMAPFASRKVGPEWFTRPFPLADEEDLEDEYVAI